jgi:hypothetical protein
LRRALREVRADRHRYWRRDDDWLDLALTQQKETTYVSKVVSDLNLRWRLNMNNFFGLTLAVALAAGFLYLKDPTTFQQIQQAVEENRADVLI